MKYWEVSILDNTGEIIKDEEVDSGCWSYIGTGNKGHYHGCIAKDRKTCIKKILSNYKNDLLKEEKELAKKRKILYKLFMEGI